MLKKRLLARAIPFPQFIPSSILKVAGVVAFVMLTAIGAKIKFLLPYTPVPVTLQVFFVLLSGAALGRNLGAVSQGIYVILGLIGLPIWAGSESGWQYLLGASGGYLIGFIAAAYVVGAIIYRQNNCHESSARWSKVPLSIVGYGAGVIVIYTIGCLWLAAWANVFNSLGWDAITVLKKGAFPFLIVDASKAVVAMLVFEIGRRLFQQDA